MKEDIRRSCEPAALYHVLGSGLQPLRLQRSGPVRGQERLLNAGSAGSVRSPSSGFSGGWEAARSRRCTLHFGIQAGENGGPLRAYVQEQEIDSVILKIQWQSFITFQTLFPPLPSRSGKISQFIKLHL